MFLNVTDPIEICPAAWFVTKKTRRVIMIIHAPKKSLTPEKTRVPPCVFAVLQLVLFGTGGVFSTGHVFPAPSPWRPRSASSRSGRKEEAPTTDCCWADLYKILGAVVLRRTTSDYNTQCFTSIALTCLKRFIRRVYCVFMVVIV